MRNFHLSASKKPPVAAARPHDGFFEGSRRDFLTIAAAGAVYNSA
jgi:hypothetical protein